MRWPAAIANDAAPPIVAADLAERLTVRITWLCNQYQGPRQYQAVRKTLTLLRQGTHEDPRDFYNRVVKAYDLSGYPQQARNVLIEETWERGLDPYLQQVIHQGLNYEMAQKLEIADNTWQHHFQTTISVNYDYLNPQEQEPIEQEFPIRRSPRKAPVQILQRSPPPRRISPQPEPVQKPPMMVDNYDDELEKMIQKYVKLEAHVTNIKRKINC